MSTKTLALAIVGASTVAAAAAGGYVALRLNGSERAGQIAASGAGPVAAAQQAPVDAQPKPAPAVTPLAVKPAGENRISTPSLEHQANTPPAAPAHAAAPEPAASPVPAPAAPANAPASATSAAATSIPPASDVPPPVVDTRADPPSPPEPEKRPVDELTIKEEAVIGIRLDAVVSTATAKVEDKVTARVARDVTVDGRTAIPSGARLEGTVTVIEHGGRFKDRARVGVRFETLILGDNTRVPIHTETIFRNGEPPTGEAASKIGASAVLGAILGGVIGGRKGAAIGGAAGAAGGTAAVMAGGVNEATIPAGTPLSLRLTAPVTVLVERDRGR